MVRDHPTPPKPALDPSGPAAGPGLLDRLSTAVLVLDRRSVIDRVGGHVPVRVDVRII